LRFLALIYGLNGDTVIPSDESVNHVCFPESLLNKGAGWAKNCLFGVKSAVILNIVFGRNVTIVAGSPVTRDMPDNVPASGPARAHHQGHEDSG
jgi:hypothetical protein